MPLGAGSRVGGYDIVALIGAGGMGEVYRARDARLGRDVALKVLAPRIAADANSLARFEREARALAALNHPNIAAIYGVAGDAGHPALILELVDGETLADRLAGGPLPVNEALEHARQIADALDAAHEAGIVHRDLKPGNIKITGDGRVKVLDFGLAKAASAAAGLETDSDPAHSPTITVHGTAHGVILGTAAYMSPEQARGKRIDRRTDIWAFGCVLVEMLGGRRAFSGETTSDIIAAIIERAPDLTALPSSTPPHVRRVIERCLEKDPKRRARDIGDVRTDLDQPAATAAVTDGHAWRGAFVALAAVVIVALAGLAAWRLSIPLPLPPESVEFTIEPPPGYTLADSAASVSPNGRDLAFVALDAKRMRSLWIRSLSSSVARRLEGTEGVRGRIGWSPDGRSIAFFVDNTWKRIPADGGAVTTIVADVVDNLGISWGPDDLLLFAPANRTSLSRVAASGGALTPVTTLDTATENSHRAARLLPDGRHFLFTARSDRLENLGIKIGSLDGGATRMLVNVASNGVYTEPGRLLYMTPDEVLMTQRLDSSTWTLDGDPQPVAARVRYNGPSFNGAFDASRDGRVLVYTPAPQGASTITWVDRAGKRVGGVGPPQRYLFLTVSRDGRMIATEIASARYGTRDIWLIDAATQALSQLTSNAATDWRPVFSPDGGTVAFASDRAGVSTVFRTSTSGAAGETLLYRHPDGGAFPQDWSPDGKQLLVTTGTTRGRPQVMLSIPVDGGTPTTLISDDTVPVTMARFSPTGDRVAFASGTATAGQVHVITLADRRRLRVSVDGGWYPRWGPDGRELFFQNPAGDIMRAVLAPDGASLASAPALLFRPCQDMGLPFDPQNNEANYDITADGRFIVRCDPEDSAPSSITVVVNWQSRLGTK